VLKCYIVAITSKDSSLMYVENMHIVLQVKSLKINEICILKVEFGSVHD